MPRPPGTAPRYWMSDHAPGGREYNDAVLPLFEARGCTA
jgi:hypothetical protein